MLDPRLLQLCDSAFPSGAFSHSFGLETALDEGRITGTRDAAAWVGSYLHGSLATLDARAVVLAMRDAALVPQLDEALSAAVFATEGRAATRRLARATLDAYHAMGLDDDALAAYRAAIDAGGAHGHHALACALGYRAIAADVADAVCAYLSSAVAALASVATRAIPLGQRDAGALLWALREPISALARAACTATSVDDLSAWAYEAEIDAMRHERLDGRMFAS